eukprot:m.294264 g.294264  ORF g.294264 m.294264 type:complete len:239 (+) comp15849_c0_seq17:280-996(+)
MSKRVQSVKQASHALHDSVRKDVEERKKKFEGQVIPDVSNDLAPYAQLPAAESFLSDKDHGYEQGWEFKTRRTSIGPMDPGTAFHEEESFRHTKRRSPKTTRKTLKPKTLPEEEEGEGGESVSVGKGASKAKDQPEDTPEEALYLWAKDNHTALLAAMTRADKRGQGELPAAKVTKCLAESGAPGDDELFSQVVPEGDAIDYAKLCTGTVIPLHVEFSDGIAYQGKGFVCVQSQLFHL